MNNQEQFDFGLELFLWFIVVRGGWYQPSTLNEVIKCLHEGRKPKLIRDLLKVAFHPGHPITQFFV